MVLLKAENNQNNVQACSVFPKLLKFSTYCDDLHLLKLFTLVGYL